MPLVSRQDLPSAPERAFILHGVLSKEECDAYVIATEAAGYRSLEKVQQLNNLLFNL